ncbi:hypothetical protein UFOVP606_55 [uncultured Caudovirales phage]|uniref:Uncharacterized protein n=1 Tax=uncultured Caudovirales phage TaxID=2100421 RepID=A0A6J5N833_9CAUD|nr:hypothetical protein UFOVP606_55 [uncultured Caudovirales phage]
MSQLDKILLQYGNALVVDIKAAIPKVTGKTANSVKLIVEELSIEVVANKSVGALVHGRKPTSTSTASTPTLYELILQWVKDKGITSSDGITTERLAYIITQSIHKKGTLLYRSGGNSTIFDTVLGQARLDTLANAIAAIQTKVIQSETIKQIQIQ